MGLAIDTVLGYYHNSGTAASALEAATAADGDSFTIRQFAATSMARMEALVVKAGTAGRAVQVKSPSFHDNVRGIEFHTVEDPATFLLPQEIGQPLVSGDQLSVEIDAAAASYATLAMLNYYQDVNGISARLHSWGDISGIIKSIKPLEVDVTNSATPGTWTDTVITTTEDLLHAGSDYAVLGIITDTAQTVIGLKGQETGNLRVCCPGSTASLDTSDYFVRMSEMHGTPHIPVFSSLNKGSLYVSTADDTASTTPKVQLVLAELSQVLAS